MEEIEEDIENQRKPEELNQGVITQTYWSPDALQRLLADAITYKSPLRDIQLIVDCGAQVNAPVKKGLRPLHYATYVNYVQCVEYLVNAGADVNLHDDIGYTPLHLCARRGSYDVMKILISSGAKLNFCDSNDSEVSDKTKSLGYLTHEPLNMAIENNHINCARLLLQNGARSNNKYFMGYEINLVPLENLECMGLLLEHNADPNVFNRCGLTPLMKACRENRPEAVKLLLKYGVDIDIQSPPRFEQKTALHFAIRGGNYDIVEMLVENGANLGRPESYKYSPLHEAILMDRDDICELLLRHKCDTEEETDNYTTPLMLICGTPGLKSCRAIVKLLLAHNANVNAHSKYISYTDPYLSPLSEYIRTYSKDIDYEVVLLLIQHGAIVSFRGYLSVVRLKDPFGVLQYWKELSGQDKVKNLLVEAATSFDIPSIKGASCDILTPEDIEILEFYGSRPRELRHLTRLYLRRTLKPNFPTAAQSLPLPSCLKSYLLFE